MTTKTKTATIDATAEVAQKSFEKGVEQAQAAFKAQIDEASKHAAVAQKGFEQAIELGKGNVEALIKSSTILSEGMQEIVKAAFAANQAAFEEGVANARALAGVKSVREAVELQTGFAKAAFEKFVALVPGFFSNDANESVSALTRFLRLCVCEELTLPERYAILGYAATVPPYVRQGLLARNVDNDAVFAGLRTPVSIVYGDADRIVSRRMYTHLEQLMPHAIVSKYADAGHMPFGERPERFNRELRDFVLSCARTVRSTATAG